MKIIRYLYWARTSDPLKHGRRKGIQHKNAKLQNWRFWDNLLLCQIPTWSIA